MLIRMKRIIVCLCLLCHGLKAEEPGKLLDSLRAELTKFYKESTKGKNDSADLKIRKIGAEEFVRGTPKGDELTEENSRNVLSLAQQLRTQGYSEKITELSVSLAKELRGQIEAERKKFNDTFNSSVKAALETGLAATTAAELDAPLQELGRLQKQMYAMAIRDSSGGTDVLHTVQQILISIQDALMNVGKS